MFHRLVAAASLGLALSFPAAAFSETRAGPSVAPNADTTRAAIEAVLAEMQAAVLAGDIPGYLRHVATDDPIFRKEQENWAADLEKFKPAQFILAIRPDPSPAPRPDPAPAPEADAKQPATPAPEQLWKDRPAEFGPTRARFTLTMTWMMPQNDNDAGPQGKGGRTRSVEYPVIFERAADGRWLFKGEQWQVMELTPGAEGAPQDFAGVRVKYDPGLEGMAKAVIAAMPEVRAHVDEGFEQRIERVQEVKLYGSMAHLQASIYLSYSDSLGGWNEPHESIKLLGRAGRQGGAGLKTVMAHEYGHVATFEFGEKATDAPWWVLEGVADLAAAKFRTNPVERVNTIVHGWARRGRLANWEDITDFRNTKGALMGNVYTQGEHMMLYVSDRFGRTKRNAWLRAMAAGKTIDQATRDALGLSFADLDAAWRADIDQRIKAEDQAKAKQPAEPAEPPMPGAPPQAPKVPLGEDPPPPGKPKMTPEQPREVPRAR
ncbi:MAG: hypothetical protein KIT68_01960 [Phycisphaeraceae bacterium]|nr:hypothetical protein [Phycisphaeraceae bacterium]